MKAGSTHIFIITTMDGVPVTKDDGTIMIYPSTHSMREHAKHLTFTTGERHHSWGLSKDKRFRAKKYYENEGFIPLGFLE